MLSSIYAQLGLAAKLKNYKDENLLSQPCDKAGEHPYCLLIVM